VLQIVLLSLQGVVGMTIRQLPSAALEVPAEYAAAIVEMHARYDPVFGERGVDILERLQVFQIFSSTWFSVGLVVLIISIVACTLDRTPRLWRQCADVRVVQPDPFFDPKLPDRALVSGGGVEAGAVRRALRARRFAVREAEVDGVRYLYGDRNRWSKMATLLTHAGLILFLVAAAVTSRLGFEDGILIAEGESAPIQRVGSEGLLYIRNFAFEAPGIETGQPTDFTTDLAVYRDGQELVRRTIRVNEPLAVAGYTIHENNWGMAPNVLVSDADGAPLWSGPVPLTDDAAGFPFGAMIVPGRDIGLQFLLRRAEDGTGLLLVLPYRVVGYRDDGTPIADVGQIRPMLLEAGDAKTTAGLDFTVGLMGFNQFVVLIVKSDPGLPLVWAAFGLLIAGLLIGFHMPRRRIWARLGRDGSLALVARSDRYVDQEREFGRLIDTLVDSRAAARSSSA